MKSSKSQQKQTFKPFSIAQQNAIELLILGKSDAEVAEAVGVNRTTIWEWHTAHPIVIGHPGAPRAEVQVDREGMPKNTLLAMAEHLDTAAYRTRLAEVEAEIRTPHLVP